MSLMIIPGTILILLLVFFCPCKYSKLQSKLIKAKPIWKIRKDQDHEMIFNGIDAGMILVYIGSMGAVALILLSVNSLNLRKLFHLSKSKRTTAVVSYRWTQDSFTKALKERLDYEALSDDDAFERATTLYPMYLAQIDPASMRPIPGKDYKWTKTSFAEAVREQYPEYRNQSDDDVFNAVTRQYPVYLRSINPVSFRPVEQRGVLAKAWDVAKELPGATKDTVAHPIKTMQSFLAPSQKP